MTELARIKAIQARLRVPVDGAIGPVTLLAIEKALDELGGFKAIPVPTLPARPGSPPTPKILTGDKQAPDSGAKPGLLSPRIALELIGHEAIVQEAYLDSEGVWTWGIGVTSRSGHSVARYKDNPQPIRKCLEIYLWLLQTRFMPDVLTEFAGRDLTEAQLAAACSFHYNTGAIRRASWVDLWLAGNVESARTAFMEWKRPASIIERRQKERDLFFDGKWSQDGMATVWPVRKPSYVPNWRLGKKVDVRPDIEALLGKAK